MMNITLPKYTHKFTVTSVKIVTWTKMLLVQKANKMRKFGGGNNKGLTIADKIHSKFAWLDLGICGTEFK